LPWIYHPLAIRKRFHLMAMWGCGLKTSIIALIFVLPNCALAKVRVEFYGEAGCPFCQDFIKGALNQTLTADGVANIVDLKLSEFGNAFFASPECGGTDNMYSSEVRQCVAQRCGIGRKSSTDLPANCFTGPLVCQHGPKECYLSKYAACAEKLSSTPVKHAEFLYCIADKYQTIVHADDLAHACAWWTGAMSIVELEQCYSSSDRVDALILEEAKSMPLHPGVPYVLVNGRALNENEHDRLLKKVCKAYKGDPKPKGCVDADMPGLGGVGDDDDLFPDDFHLYSDPSSSFLRKHSHKEAQDAQTHLCV